MKSQRLNSSDMFRSGANHAFLQSNNNFQRGPLVINFVQTLGRGGRNSLCIFELERPSRVALTMLIGLEEPRDLVRMFLMPAIARTARTGPPALTPVPSAAGFMTTLPAP